MSPDRKMNVNRIAALPRGEVVISNEVGPGNNIRHVWRFNKDGKLDQIMYKCNTCVKIGALLLLGYDIFVIHTNGTVIQIDIQAAQIVKVYTIENVVSVIHTGCLYSDPTHIDKDLLLLADEGKGVILVTDYLQIENKYMLDDSLNQAVFLTTFIITQFTLLFVILEQKRSKYITVAGSFCGVSRVSTSYMLGFHLQWLFLLKRLFSLLELVCTTFVSLTLKESSLNVYKNL